MSEHRNSLNDRDSLLEQLEWATSRKAPTNDSFERDAGELRAAWCTLSDLLAAADSDAERAGPDPVSLTTTKEAKSDRHWPVLAGGAVLSLVLSLTLLIAFFGATSPAVRQANVAEEDAPSPSSGGYASVVPQAEWRDQLDEQIADAGVFVMYLGATQSGGELSGEERTMNLLMQRLEAMALEAASESL